MNKNIVIGIIVAAIIALAGIWWLQSNKGSGPAPLPAQSPDTAEMIIQDVDALDVGDIDSEFQDIDKDLQIL